MQFYATWYTSQWTHTTLNQGQYITSIHRKENIEKLPCHFDVLFDVIAMDEKLKSF